MFSEMAGVRNITSKGIKRILCCILISVLLLTVIPCSAEESNSSDASIGTADFLQESDLKSYEDYKKGFDSAPVASDTAYADLASARGNEFTYQAEYNGKNGVVIGAEGSDFTVNITVPKKGLYGISVNYFPIEGRSSTIERAVKINGEVLFDNALHFSFRGNYKNSEDEFKRDNRGNDIRPSQVEDPTWISTYLVDYLGYMNSPYLFMLEAGVNTVTFIAQHGNIAISEISACPIPETVTYSEKLKEYNDKGYKCVDGNAIRIQAENAEYKSDPMLYPTSDRSSPLTEPNDISKIRLNTIGGSNWKTVGQELFWKVTVQESGLYALGFKFRQNSLRGLLVHRCLKINGEIPFQEAGDITFGYNDSWQNKVISVDGEECYFFFEEGKEYTLSMSVTVGSISEILEIADNSLDELNLAYRKILMIMGSQPDYYRDYQLDKSVPDAIEKFQLQGDILNDLADKLFEITGERSSATSIVSKLATQVSEMGDKPEIIQKKWTDFKSNLSTFAEWILSIKEQPLELDYFELLTKDSEMPKAKAGFFKQALHEVVSLIVSFTENYNNIGSVSDSKNAVTVWMQSGRDQAQILKSLIDNFFTSETDIQVNIQIVTGVLLQAVVSGRAPDIALNVTVGDPVNYAMRGAVCNLSQFDDFNEVKARFADSAVTPFKYNNGVYALPETQTFPMMFYRTDIFDQLGLHAPETWDNVIEILQVLQKNHMDIGIGADSMGTFAMMLYQNGGELYYDEGKKCVINSYEGITAFKLWTSLFKNYELPITYNFVNRFRTGEMPIGIVDYSTYNTLSVFAPEIRNMWKMVTVPGTQKGKTIDHSCSCGVTGCIILKDCKNREKAWQFLKWWTSCDIQKQYGKELESILGVAARYTTANLEAIKSLNWSKTDYNNLTTQLNWTKGNPEVPGGYYTSRHIDNAFRNVVYHNKDPREMINDYVKTINAEITKKRDEFKLDK